MTHPLHITVDEFGISLSLSLFSLYPKGHRRMRKIYVESFYIHYD